VHHQIEFPKTHVLAQLLDLLAKHGVQSPEGVREATRLSDYAVASGYVGMTEDVSEADYAKAIELATRVLDWAESVIASS